MTLTTTIMRDGSRCFLTLPSTAGWDAVRDHVSELNDAKVTAFVTDEVTECWIDFRYSGHEFSVNDTMGDYWFFVRDPQCPADILQRVAKHFSAVLKGVHE